MRKSQGNIIQISNNNNLGNIGQHHFQQGRDSQINNSTSSKGKFNGPSDRDESSSRVQQLLKSQDKSVMKEIKVSSNLKPEIQNVLIVGQMGAGKSTIAKTITRDHLLFKVGHGVFSETIDTTEKTVQFRGKLVNVVDMQGFADNRPNVTQADVILKLAKQVIKMKDGINICLFCLVSHVRELDKYDLEEIQLLLRLVGEGIIKNLYFVRTHLRVNDDKEKSQQGIIQLLKSHGLNGFNQEILSASLEDELQGFINQFDKILEKNLPKYMPKLAKDFDPNNPASREIFLTSPQVKDILQFKLRQLKVELEKKEIVEREILNIEYKMDEQREKIEENKKELEKQRRQNSDLQYTVQQRQQQLITQYNQQQMAINIAVAQALERERQQIWTYTYVQPTEIQYNYEDDFEDDPPPKPEAPKKKKKKHKPCNIF